MPAVVRWLGGLQDETHYAELASRMKAGQAALGHCFWIIERRTDAQLLGACGLRRADHAGTTVFRKPELGWRLREDAWRQGYAKEAALATIAWAWANLSDTELVAYTVPGNLASWGLMESLGMQRRKAFDFDHPKFPARPELCLQNAYGIARPQ
jgi:RimJ/RimL family protein N-acetyltransferase